MFFGKPNPFNNILTITGLLVASLLCSCTLWKTVKNYPPNKPFVYETNINLEANLTKDDRGVLLSQLRNQLDDSIRSRTKSYPFWEVLKEPPVYDSTAAERSVSFMRALLHSRGYLRDSIRYDTVLTVVPDDPPQLRTAVNFTVIPGKVFELDSIKFRLEHPELQSLTEATLAQSYLKRGDPFSKQTISLERERLVNQFRNNGYLRFTVDELVGIWDTLDVALLVPATTLDEQIRQLQAIQRRIDTPTANLEMILKPGVDSNRLRKYFVGHTVIYPDRSPDTVGLTPVTVPYDRNYTIIYHRNLFKHRFLTQNIYFKRGDLYNQQKFFATITRFNTMGAWRLVNIDQIPREGTDTVDFAIILTPAEKYSFIANIEGSRNSNYILQESLLGIGFSAQLINRNFARASNQSNTTFRFGTEVATKGEFVQSRQAALSHSILFPKLIPDLKWIKGQARENFRTLFTFSLANAIQKDYFNLTSLNGAWGYETAWKNKTLSLKVPNIEYTYLIKGQKLIDLIDSNPSLRGIFNDNGLVLSMQASFSIRGASAKGNHIVRFNAEESGNIANLINIKIFDNLFRFVKFDAEYIRNVQLGRKVFVYRGFAGIGVALRTRNKTTPEEINLPFFKQYYAGGPNSMRGWGIRTLGPGSSVRQDSEDNFRFGDIQVETNAELRFPLARIAGVQVNSAIFTDIGNVWFRRKTTDFPEGHFTFSKFYKDLAVSVGSGLRIDFSFFLLRLDYGLKVKNPSPVHWEAQNKWFHNFPFNGVLQLGINYPFVF